MGRGSRSRSSLEVLFVEICTSPNPSIRRLSSHIKQTIQRAFGDVSDALIGYDKFHQVRFRQQDTVADLQETVRISTLRYQGGTTTYLEVLDSQRSLYAAELTLASARGDEFRSLVQLYRALGGGWQQ